MSIEKGLIFIIALSFTAVLSFWCFSLREFSTKTYLQAYKFYISPPIKQNLKGNNNNNPEPPVHSLVWSVLEKETTISLDPDPPKFDSYQCKDRICSEFLSDEDEQNMVSCGSKSQVKLTPNCHFMNGTSRPAVALVSLPGSGNTWVRGLLEKATGICTGESV